MGREKIIIGSRGSRLALIQAEYVVAELRGIYPEREIEIKKIVTGGDRNRNIQLERIESIGIFTKELEEALLDGRIDLAVHSLKDMPTIIPGQLCLAAVLKRSDPKDVLITRGETLDELKAGSRIGTGSPRRSIQLSRYRPDLVARSIRGNIDTRLKKIQSGEVDGAILAAAAIIRLGWEKRITQYLAVEDFLPSVGQGAIGIEIRQSDDDLKELVSQINHFPTWQCIIAERVFLKTLGGGCRAPIAALATLNGEQLHLDGMAASSDGSKMLRIAKDGLLDSAEETGKNLARELLAMGASEFIEEAAVN
ncbi:hydroxymethylbilane synthase [Chloroflexota bacterium]